MIVKFKFEDNFIKDNRLCYYSVEKKLYVVDNDTAYKSLALLIPEMPEIKYDEEQKTFFVDRGLDYVEFFADIEKVLALYSPINVIRVVK
jgi:hypothetical protein